MELLEQYEVAVRPDARVADLTVEQRQLEEIFSGTAARVYGVAL